MGFLFSKPQPKEELFGLIKLKESSSESFSVVTFNTLADAYAKYHRYCSKPYRHFDYRSKLIANILASFDSDFVALQEVDKYHEFYYRTLQKLGYSSKYQRRTGLSEDGCVLAWKAESWNLVASTHIEFNEMPKCKENPDYIRNNIALFGVFENLKNGRKLIVGNAHLYWDENFSYVKYAQAMKFLEEAKFLSETHECEVVLCGDFNSMPNSNVFNLFLGKEPFLTKISLVDSEIESIYKGNPTSLKSAYENYTDSGHPQFTNFAEDFSGCLDHIFYSGHLDTVQISSLPSEEECKSEKALPNSKYPSDHLPLFAKFVFT